MQTAFVFGHKKPDTDSVCASISLSYLKNALGMNTQPRVLGNINNETKFVLNYFGVNEPTYLNDVKVQIRNMNYNKKAILNQDVSIEEAFRKLHDLNVTGIPLIDDKRKLVGYVNLKEIAKFLIEGKVTRLNTSYDNILKVLDAKEILRFDEEINGTIMAATYKVNSFTEKINLENKHILIVGDRYQILEHAINKKVKMIILVGNNILPDELVSLATANKVNVISTPFYSYKTSNKIRLANYIKSVEINKNPIKFSLTDYRNDFLDATNKYGHTNYPVVKKNDECVGMVRLIDANDYEKKQVILVDHNQSAQSVDGLEEAEILEIVDHHNLGTIGTNTPINFRAMPVGCTCTLIYKLFKESYVMIPKHIAGLMLGAILSDTLLFKSPTTTELDKQVAEKLALIADVDIEKFGMAMFKAGSSVKGMTCDQIFNQDFKTFKVNDSNIGISQVMTMDFEEIEKDKDKFIAILNNLTENLGYSVSLLFVTDIIKNGSYMFYNEKAESIVSEAYEIDKINQGVYMDGMVSRKKQMLPALLDYLERKGN